MRLLTLFAVLLFPLSTFAQMTPQLNGSVTVLHPAPGISTLYDQRGTNATVYEVNPNLSWYSQQDRYGKIQSQGYVFDPLKSEPLRVPESMRYQPHESRDIDFPKR